MSSVEPSSTTRQRWLTGAVLAVVVLVAACSGGDESSSASGPAEPGDEAPTSDPTTPPVDSSNGVSSTSVSSTSVSSTDDRSSEPDDSETPASDTTPDEPDGRDARGRIKTTRVGVTFTRVGGAQRVLVDVDAAPSGGLYQVSQFGTIQLTDADGKRPTLALDLTGATTLYRDFGLLGLAVHPDGDRAYIVYTNDENRHTVVAEYALRPNGTFDARSARTVLDLEQPYPSHIGGGIEFGPDGYLYVGTSDGGGPGDLDRTALDRDTLYGKLLRIDPTAPRDAMIPDDNPFADTDGARPEVWSYGLRNPWRFTFDAETGDLWIADVGEGRIEELNVARANDDGRNAGSGLNFGWSAFEGDEAFNEDQTAKADDAESPAFAYAHDRGRCAISGVAIAPDDTLGDIAGHVVFGDFCTGEMWALPTDGSGELKSLGTAPQPVAVVSVDDTLYVLSLTKGLLRLTVD